MGKPIRVLLVGLTHPKQEKYKSSGTSHLRNRQFDLRLTIGRFQSGGKTYNHPFMPPLVGILHYKLRLKEQNKERKSLRSIVSHKCNKRKLLNSLS